MTRSSTTQVLALLLLAGCSASDAAFGSGAGDTDTTDSADPTASGSATAPGDTGSGEAGDTTGLTGPGGDTDGEPDPALEPCAVASCEGGMCLYDDLGQAFCACPDDRVAVGLDCMPCDDVVGELAIEVPAVDVAIELTIGGAAAPAAAAETAELVLRNPASGEFIPLGKTHEGQLRARVVPTLYEIVYRHQTGNAVPANRRAVVGFLDARTTPVIALDIPLGRLEGEFSFAGAPAPAAAAENGRVWLRATASGDEVLLGETAAQSYAVNVIPGAYEIYYEAISGSATAPLNRRAQIGQLLVDPLAEVAQVAPIDIPVVEIAGSFLVDGAPAPGAAAENGRVRLHGSGTGDEFVIGETRNGSYAVRVVPGEYEIIYERIAGSATMPANTHGRVGTLDTADAASHEVDIDTVTVSGSFLVDGVPPPADANDDGLILLRDELSGDEVLLGSTAAGSFDRIVIAGSYGLHYAQDTSAGGVPGNANARLGTVDVAAAPSFDVDVPTAFVSGTITLGDGVPPDSDYDDGWVYLHDPDSGDTVLLANTRMGVYSAAVVPGLYEVVYTVETAGGQVPINADSVVIDTVEIDGVVDLAIDIPVRALTGTITADSAANERGSVYLRAAGSATRSLLGNTADAGFTQPVVPGRYLVTYGVDASTGTLPVNPDAPLLCVQVP